MMRSILTVGLALLLTSQSDLACAQWVQANGPYQPSTGILKNITSIGGNIYVFDQHSGLYITTDDGNSWLLTSNQFLNGQLYSLSSAGSTLYAGTYSGVSASNNNGGSWTTDTVGMGDALIYGFCTNGTTLYAAGMDSTGRFGAVYVSSDGAASWTSIGTFYSIPAILAVSGPKLLMAYNSPQSAVLSTTDNGAHWIADTAGMVPQSIYALLDDGPYVFAAGYLAVYRSTDHGSSWSIANSGLVGHHVIALAQSGTVLIAGTMEGLIFRSTDSGSSWNPTTVSFSPTPSMQFSVSGNTVFAATDSSGVFRSSDQGATWKNVNPGGEIFARTTSVCSGDSNIFVGVPGLGVFSSTDDGANWHSISSLSSYYLNYEKYLDYPLAAHNDDLYVGTPNGVYAFDKITGYSQVSVNSGLPTGIVTNLLVNDDNIYVSFTNELFRSNNNGISWVLADNNFNYYYKDLTTDGTDLLVSGGGVDRSTDSGKNWIWMSDSLPPKKFNPYMQRVVAIGNDLYGANGPVFLSTNAGNSWFAIDSGMLGETSTAIIASGTHVFCGNDQGVFVLTDGQTMWRSISDGLPQGDSIFDLTIHGQTLIAITAEGVWRRPLSEVTSSVPAVQTHSDRIQNYPNPFSRSTTITFSSENEGYAKLTIVNLIGAQVAQLFSGELSAGEHSFMWSDPSGLPDGIYECILQMDGQVLRMPMILAR
jgi:photosystem II stability/assembly factor-like uncharacterized protein